MHTSTGSFIAACFLILSMAASPALAQRGPVTPWQDSTFTTSDGVQIRYVSGGSGAAIVFVPGWTMPAEIWEPQLRHFAASHRVVAMDPRSQGRSQMVAEGNFTERRAKDIEELLEHLGGDPVVLVGWSLGVNEVLEMIDQSGTRRLAAIVLCDGAVWSSDRPGLARYFESILAGTLTDRRTFTATFVRSMYRMPQDSSYLQRITEGALKTPTPTAYTLLAGSYLFGRRDWRPVLARIDRPVLWVGTPGTRADAEAVRTGVARAQVEIFERAGHALFADEPNRFNALLESFLRRLR